MTMAKLSTGQRFSPDAVAVAGEGLEPQARLFLGALERLRSGQHEGLPAGVDGEPAGRVTVAGGPGAASSLLEAQPAQLRQLVAALAAAERSVRAAPATVRRHLLLGFPPSGGALARLGNAALAGLVQAVARSLGRTGTTVHLLLPGRPGSEAALARLAAFLLSRRADWLTGTVHAAPGAALPPAFPGAVPTWPEALVARTRAEEEASPPEPALRPREHVFVAGASSELGRACALAWAAEHASLALCDSLPPEELVPAVSRLGGLPLPVEADGRSPARLEQALRRACDHFGPLATLLLAFGQPAAAPAGGAAAEGPEGGGPRGGEDWRQEWLERELLGAWQLCRLAPPYFGPEGGAIVVDAGPAAVRETAERPAAAMLARARVALVRELARELAPAGIRVNAVARAGVGGVAARRRDRPGAAPGEAALLALLPRPVPPLEDVAEVARWLASPACPLSGAVLPVDAGAAVA
ncbi:MAG: SDR family oxidoreductase [Bacillota bacterium]|nr:SDR family oxidoreductase [Bacillota bacterium]